MTPWTVAPQLLYPWDSSGKNTEIDCPFLLQGIFPTQGSNPRLLQLLPQQVGFFTTEPPVKSREPRRNSYSITCNLRHPFRNAKNSPSAHHLSSSALTQVWWRLSKWYCWPRWVGPDGQSSLYISCFSILSGPLSAQSLSQGPCKIASKASSLCFREDFSIQPSGA